ncbi:MAG: tetraacyldisaccharide 4'-kinase [Thermoanaerobaculia bacterium]|nr:tetraacyldisaccharide 4'-kinase [Thermoanaerobaculia bacterium]
MSLILKAAELAYRGVNRARRALYRAGILSSRRLPRAVVSIGNIAIGGGGKTPATIAIAHALQDRGLRVAILTRGYGGRATDEPGTIVSGVDAERFGDEPSLLAKRLAGIDVVVGGDRFESGTRYLAAHDCDVFLLDDGFQHLQLHRDLDIVLDLPSARWQREGRSALSAATFVLRRVERLTGAPFEAALEPVAFSLGGSAWPVDELRGKRVLAFSGLADNEQFFASLRGVGAELAGVRSFPDHHRYANDEIAALRTEAAALHAAPVTTEKDWVKIGDESVGVVESAMRISGMEEIVERIEQLARAREGQRS